jgi:hypothetical protein
MNSRGVDEDDLDITLGQNAANGLARGVGRRGSDRHLGAHDLIQQRRLADVRSTNNGGKTGVGHSSSDRGSTRTSSMRRPTSRTTVSW